MVIFYYKSILKTIKKLFLKVIHNLKTIKKLSFDYQKVIFRLSKGYFSFYVDNS